MTHGLANVFVNNQRVEDLDEPQLKVRDIIKAYGRDPGRCIVYRLHSDEETAGTPVDLDDRIDLAQIPGNLFLRCETRRTEATAPSPERHRDGALHLTEDERIPAYEGTLGGQEADETLDAEEREPEELLSPETGTHPAGDPSGHQFYEREPGTKWGREETTSEPSPTSERKPSALGSELRAPPTNGRPSSRDAGARVRRGSASAASTRSPRNSVSRRKVKEQATKRRGAR